MSTYGDYVTSRTVSKKSSIQFKHAKRRHGGYIHDRYDDIINTIQLSHVRAHKILETLFPNMTSQQRRRIPQQCAHIWEYFYYYAKAACHPNTLCLTPISDQFLVIQETGESYLRHLILFVAHYEHDIEKRKVYMDHIINALIHMYAYPVDDHCQTQISYNNTNVPTFPSQTKWCLSQDQIYVLKYLWERNAELLPEHLEKIETMT